MDSDNLLGCVTPPKTWRAVLVNGFVTDFQKRTLQVLRIRRQVACSDFPPPMCDDSLFVADYLHYYEKTVIFNLKKPFYETNTLFCFRSREKK